MRCALLVLLAGCCGGGGTRMVMGSTTHGDTPQSLGPTFAVVSTDAAPLVFSRRGAGDRELRYVFRREASPTDRALHAVAIDRGFATAVGDGGVAVRRDKAGGWKAEPTGTDAALRGIVVATWEGHDYAWMPDDPRAVALYAVGDRGTIVRRAADGTWAVQKSGVDVDLHAVGADAAEAIAVGDRGTVLWLHGGAWLAAESHTDVALRAVTMSDHAVVIVGDAGTVLECGFRGDTMECSPRPHPTEANLIWVSERTVRWDAEGIHGFTIHELEAFTATGGRLRRSAWTPIDFAAGLDAPFAVRGYDAQHWSFDIADPEDVAVGPAGAIALVDPYKASLVSVGGAVDPSVQPALAAHDPTEPGAFDVQHLPEAVDLDAAAFEGLDGFVVGDRGTILQLTVEGAKIPVATLL